MSGIGELLAGGAVGTLCSEVYSGVSKLISKFRQFKPLFENIQSTLHFLQPLIIQIEAQNKELKLPDKEMENIRNELRKGLNLIHECLENPEWYKMPKYHDQLLEFDRSLKRQLDLMLVQALRDGKTSLLMLTEQAGKLGELTVYVKEILELARRINLSKPETETSNASPLPFGLGEELKQIIANIVAQYQNQNQNQIGGWCAIPEPPPFTVGLDVHVDELKVELLKDEASMLVVTGLGGCGKTTLAQKICKDQKVKDKFKDNIFFVTVSKKSNCLVVQELYQQKGSQVPAFQDEAIAFNRLQEFLNTTGQDPLLLVLDDVSPGSDSLLDKLDEFKRRNHNILVTSKVKFPRFGHAHPLGTLEQGDAMTLFRRSASRTDRSSYIPDNLAEQIVQLCKGFPLAITTIGKSVCEQPTEIWEIRVRELSKRSSILDSEDYLLACLKSSLDALDERLADIKECFIDLASFPEDRGIPAVALIDMWAELYGLDEDFLSIAHIHELTNRNLANLVTRNGKMELDGYYSEHFVTQHDMLRNLAIHQTDQDEIGQEKRLIIEICGDNLPNGWTGRKNKPKKTRLLSISTDGLSSAKWHDMHLPKAEVLVLNFQTENYVLPKFVKKMSKLKVLIVTNYGVLQADLSNFKLLGSLANLKRIRLERISIPSISKKSIQLKSLQKISLFMCSIGQAFSNSSSKS
ncbi:hypothetical protein ACE6H2_024463 [Prunus campanulata]